MARTRALKSSNDSSRFNNRVSIGSGTGQGYCRTRGCLFGFLVLWEAEIPVQDETLTFRVTHHPFPISAELRVVRRQQLEAGHDPGAELVDDGPIAEVGVHLPVGCDGAEVDRRGRGRVVAR